MRHKARGMSLIELVIAIVIIGVGVAGVLAAFQQATRASADPLVHKQMLAIAEQMLEETMLRSHASQPNPPPSKTCARDTFNDLGDYDGYSSAGICDLSGNDIDGLAGYSVAVDLADEPTLGGTTPARRIEVTVTHGGETLTLTSYRSGWAQ